MSVGANPVCPRTPDRKMLFGEIAGPRRFQTRIAISIYVPHAPSKKISRSNRRPTVGLRQRSRERPDRLVRIASPTKHGSLRRSQACHGLAVQLILRDVGRVANLHPKGVRAAGRTCKSRTRCAGCGFVSYGGLLFAATDEFQTLRIADQNGFPARYNDASICPLRQNPADGKQRGAGQLRQFLP